MVKALLNKTKVIKSIVGPVLEELGFKYLRKEFGIVWTFGKQLDIDELYSYIADVKKSTENIIDYRRRCI